MPGTASSPASTTSRVGTERQPHRPPSLGARRRGASPPAWFARGSAAQWVRLSLFLLPMTFACLLPASWARAGEEPPPAGATAPIAAGERDPQEHVRVSLSGMAARTQVDLELRGGTRYSGSLLGWDDAGHRWWFENAEGEVPIDPAIIVRVLAPAVVQVEGTGNPRALYSGQGPAAPAVRYGWKPTWRSHAGVALSMVWPGLGQLVQSRERHAGVPFLITQLFFAGGGALAMWSWQKQGNVAARAVGIGFFVGAGVNLGISAVHAFQSGRTWEPIEAQSSP